MVTGEERQEGQDALADGGRRDIDVVEVEGEAGERPYAKHECCGYEDLTAI
jgi:hypothetical protein